MSVETERGIGLEREGIRAARVFWNLFTPRFTKRRSRGEKASSRGWSAGVPHGPAHRPLAERQVHRPEPSSEEHIAWGGPNRPIERGQFDALQRDLVASLAGATLFVQDCFAGADPRYRLPVRVITEFAWHSLFARNLFIRAAIRPASDQRRSSPSSTSPSFKADPRAPRHALGSRHRAQLREAPRAHRRHQLRRRDQEVGLQRDELPAAARAACCRCTARRTSARDGDVALFFGLSGTGKTTLSSDPDRAA